MYSYFSHAKIRIRILLALLALTLVALLSFAVISFIGMKNLGDYTTELNEGLGQEALRVSKNAMQNLARDGILRITIDQANLFNGEFKAIESELHLLARLTERAWRDQDTSSPTPLFQKLLVENPFISDITLATTNGRFNIYTRGSQPSLTYDGHDLDWYTRAVSTKKPGWSAPYVSPRDNHQYINYSQPLFDHQQRLSGVIGIAISHRTINDSIRRTQLNNQGAAILLNRNRKVIAKAGMAADSASAEAEYFQLDSDGEERRRIEEALLAGKSGIDRGFYRQRECFVAYAPVASTQWSVLLVLPVEDVNAPIRPTERLITSQVSTVRTQVLSKISLSLVILVFICFILIGAVVVVARRVSGIITAPIQELENGVKIIGEGNLGFRLNIHSGDEIEELAGSFNKMTTDLQNYIRNLTETTAAKERIQGELKVATDIQASLLPRIFPPFPDRPEFDIYAIMDPAKEVGGDFYDFFFIDDRHLFFVIGDVSDKGVPAALFMMVSKTLLKTEALRKGSPAEILAGVNNLLYPDNETMMFVTIFCAILDTETGELAYSSAGHNPPLYCPDGAAPQFMTVPPGLVAGAMADSTYSNRIMQLRPNDIILLYTDGVTEAMNSAAMLYGEERLVSAAYLRKTDCVHDFIASLREDVLRYTDGAKQSDDITMLALRFLGGSTGKGAS
jgi:sigma-B regulation protein RsbU (phosphoserine phosphatase)